MKVHSGTIQRIYVSAEAAKEFEQHLAEQEKAAQAEGTALDRLDVALRGGSAKIEVIGVRDLAGLLALLWPDLGVSE